MAFDVGEVVTKGFKDVFQTKIFYFVLIWSLIDFALLAILGTVGFNPMSGLDLDAQSLPPSFAVFLILFMFIWVLIHLFMVHIVIKYLSKKSNGLNKDLIKGVGFSAINFVCYGIIITLVYFIFLIFVTVAFILGGLVLGLISTLVPMLGVILGVLLTVVFILCLAFFWLYLYVGLSVVPYHVVLEKKDIISAIMKGWVLTKKHRFQLFGILFVAWAVMIPLFIMNLLFSLTPILGNVVNVLVSNLFIVWILVVLYEAYVSLKSAK